MFEGNSMSTTGRFANRKEAGKALATHLLGRKLEDPVILALPRGGVPVAVEIARTLHAPLDLVFVRKIGMPFQSEVAAAAVVDGGTPEIVVNEVVAGFDRMTDAEIERRARIELVEIERRRRVYLADRPRVSLDGRVVILVDDGIATGASIRAAIAALRRKRPKMLVLAIPVAPAELIERLQAEVDAIVCLATPRPFYAVGLHYRDFHQVPDEEVIGLLAQADASERAGKGRRTTSSA